MEFNPNRPRLRVRFSLAHELAHSLFEDATERPRHRLATEDRRGDEWQLELLCNIAAAELLMPAEGFAGFEDASLDLEDLLALREQYQVSMEALVLRVVETSVLPSAAIAAAPMETPGRYRIDYVVPSQNFDIAIGNRAGVDSSILARCTAVGYTNSGFENWGERPVYIQAIGIPPYPGDSLPRVCAIVMPASSVTERLPKIRYLRGDVLKPHGAGRRVIAQVVNDRSALWGGRSVASQAARRWPSAQEDFRAWANRDGLRLGTMHLVQIEEALWLASLVAQHGFGAQQRQRLRYDALQSCLEHLGDTCLQLETSVHLPLIGTGYGGSDWQHTESLIDSALGARGLDVTIYIRPNEKPPASVVVTEEDSSGSHQQQQLL